MPRHFEQAFHPSLVEPIKAFDCDKRDSKKLVAKKFLLAPLIMGGVHSKHRDIS